MLTTYDIAYSNFPFTTNSSLRLNTSHKLSPGVICNAVLFPRCEHTVNSAHISYIGKAAANPKMGEIRIADDDNNQLCAVRFDTVDTSADLLYGYAYDSVGYCGVIVALPELRNTLTGVYKPGADSFVFTPCVLRPQGLESSKPKLMYEGEVVNEVAVTALGNDADTAARFLNPIEYLEVVVDGMKLSAATASVDDALCLITPAPGSHVRIIPSLTENNTILIGGGSDV